jgi:hypothetical protein
MAKICTDDQEHQTTSEACYHYNWMRKRLGWAILLDVLHAVMQEWLARMDTALSK